MVRLASASTWNIQLSLPFHTFRFSGNIFILAPSIGQTCFLGRFCGALVSRRMSFSGGSWGVLVICSQEILSLTITNGVTRRALSVVSRHTSQDSAWDNMYQMGMYYITRCALRPKLGIARRIIWEVRNHARCSQMLTPRVIQTAHFFSHGPGKPWYPKPVTRSFWTFLLWCT